MAPEFDALLALVNDWLEAEHALLKQTGTASIEPLIAAGMEAHLAAQQLERDRKALANPLHFHPNEVPETEEWLITHSYYPFKVPAAGRAKFMAALRRRRLFKVSQHAHPHFGAVLYAYTDEFRVYPEAYHFRLTFALDNGSLKLLQSCEACRCRGTGIIDGYKPKGGPYPASGAACDRGCEGAGFVHQWGFVVGDVGPALHTVRPDQPELWASLAVHERP